MRTYKWIIIGIGVFVALVITASAQIIFKFTYQDVLYSNFWAFIFSLIAIAILSIVGSIFVGMYISIRYFSARNFTPFEEEMLKMRKDIIEIKTKLNRYEGKDKEDEIKN